MRQWEFVKSFLPYKMKRQVRELFVSTTMVNLALAMVMIFEPIYLYNIGYSLQQIMLFYLITYILYFVIMPLGAKYAKKHGYERGIFFGTTLFIVYYVILFFVSKYAILFYIAPLILAVQKMFYWPAYHADFARFSDQEEEGRELSSISVINSFVFIIGPALAGFIIASWGYGALFTVASILFLVSNIPTLLTTEEFSPQSFSYFDSYKSLFSRKNLKSLIAYFGFGEEFVVLVVWPVFISLIIKDFFQLGVVVALATLVTTLITFSVGKLTDHKNKRAVLSLGSAVYSLSWFMRLLVVNATGIFFVDSLSRLGKDSLSIPMMAITYERAKDVKEDQHHHVMSSVVFFEMSLVIGKLIAIALIFFALFFVGSELLAFKFTFILAGVMTLLYMLL